MVIEQHNGGKLDLVLFPLVTRHLKVVSVVSQISAYQTKVIDTKVIPVYDCNQILILIGTCNCFTSKEEVWFMNAFGKKIPTRFLFYLHRIL